jgi:hypothetical protein
MPWQFVGFCISRSMNPQMFFFLSKTKMERRRIERFRWILNMPNMVSKDCKGHSGGLALFRQRM